MSNLEFLRKLHKPVMVHEVLEAFGVKDLALLQRRLRIIDATAGLGGHIEELISRGCVVLGIDQDSDMLKLAQERLKLLFESGAFRGVLACPISEDELRKSYKLIHGNFKDIARIAADNSFLGCDGVLFDLGLSLPQIVSEERGFSFKNELALLDMRMDRGGMQVSGSDLLNVLRRDQLTSMFETILDRRVASRLSSLVVKYREGKKFERVADFKKVIKKAGIKSGKKSAETLPFLALRIAVNSEYQNIAQWLEGALSILKPGGKIVVISFHSGEDRVVASKFLEFRKKGWGSQIGDVVTPSEKEVRENIHSRSALLRVFKKSD